MEFKFGVSNSFILQFSNADVLIDLNKNTLSSISNIFGNLIIRRFLLLENARDLIILILFP